MRDDFEDFNDIWDHEPRRTNALFVIACTSSAILSGAIVWAVIRWLAG